MRRQYCVWFSWITNILLQPHALDVVPPAEQKWLQPHLHLIHHWTCVEHSSCASVYNRASETEVHWKHSISNLRRLMSNDSLPRKTIKGLNNPRIGRVVFEEINAADEKIIQVKKTILHWWGPLFNGGQWKVSLVDLIHLSNERIYWDLLLTCTAAYATQRPKTWSIPWISAFDGFDALRTPSMADVGPVHIHRRNWRNQLLGPANNK